MITGHEKAFTVLWFTLHLHGSHTWKENEIALHELFMFLTHKFIEQQDDDKFATCRLLSDLLQSATAVSSI